MPHRLENAKSTKQMAPRGWQCSSSDVFSVFVGINHQSYVHRLLLASNPLPAEVVFRLRMRSSSIEFFLSFSSSSSSSASLSLSFPYNECCTMLGGLRRLVTKRVHELQPNVHVFSRVPPFLFDFLGVKLRNKKSFANGLANPKNKQE